MDMTCARLKLNEQVETTRLPRLPYDIVQCITRRSKVAIAAMKYSYQR
jgi:hypothetical protein